MKNVFIDCGGHMGESIKLFKSSTEYKDDFTIYSFEPVPKLAAQYRDMDGITVFEKAIWVYDGTISFYLAEASDGNTLFQGKRTGGVDRKHPIEVECIDFSKWIVDTFNKRDYIIVKMDIEGAEFRVLDKMIMDGAINYIDKIYIEWHFAFDGFPDMERYPRLRGELDNRNVVVHPEMKKVIRARDE